MRDIFLRLGTRGTGSDRKGAQAVYRSGRGARCVSLFCDSVKSRRREVRGVAVDFRPSNPRVVHRAVFLDQQRQRPSSGGTSRRRAAGYWHSGGPGCMPSGGLGGGCRISAAFFPMMSARPIRPGADLVIQTHSHPTGKPEQEQSSIGIYSRKRFPASCSSTIRAAFADEFPPARAIIACTISSRFPTR